MAKVLDGRARAGHGLLLEHDELAWSVLAGRVPLPVRVGVPVSAVGPDRGSPKSSRLARAPVSPKRSWGRVVRLRSPRTLRPPCGPRGAFSHRVRRRGQDRRSRRRAVRHPPRPRRPARGALACFTTRDPAESTVADWLWAVFAQKRPKPELTPLAAEGSASARCFGLIPTRWFRAAWRSRRRRHGSRLGPRL
jgi:hypothetical protein